MVVSPEHWANFFLDNMPSFCIGIADEFSGPTDEKFVNIRAVFAAETRGSPRALAEGIAEDVDLDLARDGVRSRCDAPPHLLRTELPVIPIIVNCLAGMPAPLHRCHALGVALRRTVDRRTERVALLGTGGLSHWPAMPESDRSASILTGAFSMRSSTGASSFLSYPKEKLEAEAGPVRHEIRTWITVAGAANGARIARLSACARLVDRLRRRRVGDRGGWMFTRLKRDIFGLGLPDSSPSCSRLREHDDEPDRYCPRAPNGRRFPAPACSLPKA